MSILLLWQQERGGTAVGFGDEPDALFSLKAVAGHNSSAMNQCGIVGLAVLDIQLAPISDDVSNQIFKG